MKNKIFQVYIIALLTPPFISINNMCLVAQEWPCTFIFIDNSEGVKTIDAFGIKCIPGDLIISGGQNKIDLKGLSNITSIYGSLIIKSNQKLRNLTGLASLTYVGGTLLIENNDRLTDIKSLSNLKYVGKGITIINNPSLDDSTPRCYLNNLNMKLEY